ncbi:uncharacterized protein FSUBG_10853 [Fusarium subglutinans]|uniref:Uncharacterized protein n=1 Tax=Gibberella subglutinans TaxID=42677 RepID=A0A8H5LEA6_GIBSU|nr:uncharacterized protein FSUBG_10853 [Fusarium subglutinans]KAF5590442.1 hypothetical protein FSUBG_10853 [Fusarium subglutinans]
MVDPQTADEMASWLLDDSTPERLSNEGEDLSPKKRRTTTPRNSVSIDGNQAIPPLDFPSPIKTPLRSLDTRPRASRMGKHSPSKAVGIVPRRAATTGRHRDTSQKRPSTSLQRRHVPTRSLSYDPLKFHPTKDFALATSVALETCDNNARNRVAEGCQIPRIQDRCAGEEISGKLAAMLAATNALKPLPQQANCSTSRFTRMVPSKVRAKVSNAWDRFHPKAVNHEETQARAFSHLGDEQGDGWSRGSLVPTPRSHASTENASPISNIELRLNEGDNLNKSKVQQIVGGRVNRKPLADDGKSLRNGKLVEDPFSERADRRALTCFDNRLNQGSHDDPKTPPPSLYNPFESEKGFDDNIEDRFLNSTPVGSSTPRILVERPSTSSSGSCSVDSDMHIPETHFNERPGSLSTTGRKEIGQHHFFGHKLLEPVGDVLANSITQARQVSDKAKRDLHTSSRTKKHPSPSKEALEKLELQFQQYTHGRVSEPVKYDMDELIMESMDASPSLRACERKRLSLARLSVTNIDELVDPMCGKVHHRRGSSTSMLQLVRGPYVLQNSVKLHKDIRLMPPYRPAGVSPSDVDELH